MTRLTVRDLAHEARISSLEAQLAKLVARVEALERCVPKPKPVPVLLPGEREARIAMGKIARRWADHYGVTVERMRSQDKRRVFMEPRWKAWEECHRAGYSTPMIGRYFGGRDHSTILHGIARLFQCEAPPE